MNHTDRTGITYSNVPAIDDLLVLNRRLHLALVRAMAHRPYCPWCYGLRRGEQIRHVKGCALIMLLDDAVKATQAEREQ